MPSPRPLSLRSNGLPVLRSSGVPALALAALLFTQGCPGGGDDDDDDPGTDIKAALEQIDGLTVEEKPTALPGYRFFYLTYLQPADHAQPGGQQFAQRLTLLHRDADAPLVLYSGGYFVSLADRRVELAELLSANQLSVEHRFFEPSRPDPADWSTLTIEQSAADFHRLVEALKPIYPAAWVGTGGSKGGMTSIFHRRFYPEDLEATVAYVAPISLEAGDDRYVTFLEQVGDPACRQQIASFQRTVLERRGAMIDRMQEQGAQQGLTYDFLGEDMALEHATLEFGFYVWQYYDASLCDEIPPPSASDDQVYGFLDSIADMSFFSDDLVAAFEPYYYQAATQFGYPIVSESAVADLLLYPGTDIAPVYVSPSIPVAYDPGSMPDILDWIDTSGAQLMLLYGENDPWTAGAIPLGGAVDSYRYTVPAGNHRSRLMDLPEPDRSAALTTLERWMGVSIDATVAKPATPAFFDEARMGRDR